MLTITLFVGGNPQNVRDRLLQGGNLEQATNDYGMGNKSRLKGFMAGEKEDTDENAAPIADLFPHCKARGR
jgi:hypothetical protein